MNELDWNSGIRADCTFCGDAGFLYRNDALDRTIAMCDKCRDDFTRRQEFVGAMTISRPAAAKERP